MRILVYSKGNHGTGARLLDAVRRIAPDSIAEFYSMPGDVLHRLRRKKGDLSVVILCAHSHADLEEILGFRSLLHDLRSILILPDRESLTIARGLTLHPRFFSFVDSDFEDVSSVLARMLRIYGKQSGAFDI